MARQRDLIGPLTVLLILASSLLVIASGAGVESVSPASKAATTTTTPEPEPEKDEFFDADDEPEWFSHHDGYSDEDDELYYDAIDNMDQLPEDMCSHVEQERCSTCCLGNGFKGFDWYQNAHICMCNY